jgi:uncharacterized protein (TIGR02145 family)
LAPASDAEWTQLETYLANNGYNYDGSTGPVSGSGVRDKIAKSLASEIGWSTSDVEGSPGNTEDYVEYINKSGFTALPGGMRYSDGLFYNIGNDGFWWSTTESSSNIVWYRLLRYNYSNVSSTKTKRLTGYLCVVSGISLFGYKSRGLLPSWRHCRSGALVQLRGWFLRHLAPGQVCQVCTRGTFAGFLPWCLYLNK